MHFSKSYSQLLATLPSELQNSAIEYRQLKKLINELVAELESLGLGPLVLHELQQKGAKVQSRSFSVPASSSLSEGKTRQRQLRGDKPSAPESETDSCHLSVSWPSILPSIFAGRSSPTRVTYELADPGESGEIVSRLRLWIKGSCPLSSSSLSKISTEDLDDFYDVKLSPPITPHNALRASLSIPTASEHDSSLTQAAPTSLQHECTDDVVMAMPSQVTQCPRHDLYYGVSHPDDGEVVIPLVSDVAFFRLLTNALNALSVSLNACQTNLVIAIRALSTTVAQTSRPASVKGKSDLYTWRAIFELYMEAQVFESTSECDRGERSVEESEARLARFARRAEQGGFSFKSAASRDGLRRFLELNVWLMNLKKFQTANAEAERKILKKHAKRTALPLPSSAWELIPALEIGQSTASVPHVLVVTLTETLMPIVPHIDDYICLICTAIAFKPIRLRCGHLFCVRCLVKMQKRRQDHCPMCRTSAVLSADQSNVDYALINFMLDWFPKETKEKVKANNLESTKEKMEELGLDTRCIIM